MSNNTYTMQVKSAIRLCGDENKKVQALSDFIKKCSDGSSFDYAGWHCPHNEWIEDFGDLSAIPIAKGNIYFPEFDDYVLEGDYKIYFINESEYAICGEFDPTIIAKNPESIIQFCQDFDIPIEYIETNAIVCQTL